MLGNISTLSGIRRDKDSPDKDLWICEIRKEDVEVYIKDCKPLLRPLSDLIEEIEHKGEKFIPVDRLACKWDTKTDNEYFFEAQYQGERTYLTDLPFTMQQLFEWHFDIFGLLDAGLASRKKR